MNIKKKNDIILALIIIAVMAAVVVFVVVSNIERDDEDENATVVTGEQLRIRRLRNKALFGDDMRFEFRIVEGHNVFSSGSIARSIVTPGTSIHNPFYTDIIFVHTKEESIGFTDDIIVAWPRTNAETGEVDIIFYEAIISGIYWALDRSEEELTRTIGSSAGQLFRPIVTLEEFGLSYPLTIEDFVDNWEKVSELWFTLIDVERSRIMNEAGRAGREN